MPLPLHYKDKYPSAENTFYQKCPQCDHPLGDSTTIQRDRQFLFYRVHFFCSTCDYWLQNRLENFNILCTLEDAESNPPSADQQELSLALTIFITQELIEEGVDAYPLGKVSTFSEDLIIKTATEETRLQLEIDCCNLGVKLFDEERYELGVLALERAVEELMSYKAQFREKIVELNPYSELIPNLHYNLSSIYKKFPTEKIKKKRLADYYDRYVILLDPEGKQRAGQSLWQRIIQFFRSGDS